MKERIEKKLGMTIEDFSNKLKKFHDMCSKTGMMVEMENPLSGLSAEEQDFLVDYVVENGLEIYA